MAKLNDLFISFELELRSIENSFSKCRSHSFVPALPVTYKATEDGCLVSLWDAWNRFLRSAVITSASGTVTGIGGSNYIPIKNRSESQLLRFITSQHNSQNFGIKNGEPKWLDKTILSSIIPVLGLANSSELLAGLKNTITISGKPLFDPIEEIKICRNFTAHKGVKTFNAMKLNTLDKFIDLPSYTREVIDGKERFSIWIEFLLTRAKLMLY